MIDHFIEADERNVAEPKDNVGALSSPCSASLVMQRPAMGFRSSK
ncbi:hypothetical protein CDS [Bradyrhizobium sp.]|nr:hypothetical protein CDS [Bradyrhizobium sp.]